MPRVQRERILFTTDAATRHAVHEATVGRLHTLYPRRPDDEALSEYDFTDFYDDYISGILSPRHTSYLWDLLKGYDEHAYGLLIKHGECDKYFTNPTTATARAFLTAYGIAHPLQSLLDNVKVLSFASSSSGGSRRTPTVAAPVAPAFRMAQDPALEAHMRAWAWTDAYHDVRAHAEVPPHVREWMFDQQTVFPDTLTSSDPTLLTQLLARTWAREANMKYTEHKTPLGKRTYTEAEDTAFFRLFVNWMGTQNATCMLDGLLVNLSKSATHLDHWHGLVETAFLLVLFENGWTYYGKLAKLTLRSASPQVKPIINHLALIGGLVQNADAPLFSAFLLKYAAALTGILKKAGKPNATVSLEASSQPPQWLAFTVSPGGKELTLSDERRCKIQKHTWKYKEARHLHTFHLPYTKKHFTNMMLAHGGTASVGTSDALQLERAVFLNFARDAWKADIALQRGAMFLTHDRLAYCMYSMLARHAGLPNLGMLIIMDDRNEVIVHATATI